MSDDSNRSQKSQVKLALFQIKSLISQKKFRFLEDRRKNMETLAALGWLPQDVLDVIYDLEVEDYFSGPSDDWNSDDRNCIWEFGKCLPDEQKTIYIKLKLTDDILAISFHFQEKEIVYPFK